MEFIFTHLLPYFIVGYLCGSLVLTLLRHRGESAFQNHVAFCPHTLVLALLCYLVTLYDLFSVTEYTTLDKVFGTLGSVFLIWGVATLWKQRRLKK